MADSIFELRTKANDGKDIDLRIYEGKVLLIVNTASKCGFTPQYKGLEALYKKYKDRGLVVLGFPCDQFAHQEPAGDAEIASFCEINFGVSFPLMAKSAVNGRLVNPVFAFLKSKARGSIKWNFTKFLVARDGATVKRFPPTAEPAGLAKDIERRAASGAPRNTLGDCRASPRPRSATPAGLRSIRATRRSAPGGPATPNRFGSNSTPR
jgi:glutathione peroxidase-family protein